jgi:opacity protein-like surface antigen
MRRANFLLIVVLVLSLVTILPTLAEAEWYGSLYLGAAFPKDEDVTVRSAGSGVTTRTVTSVDFGTSFEVGGRIGHWFEKDRWIGFAVDASYFKMEDSITDIDIVPLSFLVMFQYPGEKVQPYLGVGLGIFFTDIDQRVNLTSFGLGTQTASESTVDTGLDLRAGITVPVKGNFSILGEYRYTYFRPDYEDTISGVQVNIDTDSNTHHLLVGVKYRF